MFHGVENLPVRPAEWRRNCSDSWRGTSLRTSTCGQPLGDQWQFTKDQLVHSKKIPKHDFSRLFVGVYTVVRGKTSLFRLASRFMFHNMRKKIEFRFHERVREVKHVTELTKRPNSSRKMRGRNRQGFGKIRQRIHDNLDGIYPPLATQWGKTLALFGNY